MSREKNLVKNTFIITIGRICTQLVSFFLLPLYTAILSTEEYGIVDLMNTLVSILLPLVTFQVEQALFRELIEVRNNEEGKIKIISSGVLTVCIQCLVYLAVFIIIAPLINNNYKFFLASNVITNIFISLFLQISRGLGDNKRYAIGSFLSASIIIIFNVLFLVLLQLGAYGMLLATMTGQIIACGYLAYTLKLYKYIRIKYYKKSIIFKLWKYSIPLIPNAISWWVIDASDRVIVSTFLGVDQNGILAASLKFASLLSSMNYIFTLSWTESISVAINDPDIKSYFNKMINMILGIFISLSVGMISCIPFVFDILINSKYSEGYGLIPISILATLFNVVVGVVSVIYVAKKNTKAIAQTSFFAATINIIVHLGLLKVCGLYAAVISSFIAFFSMSIYRIADIRKKYISIEVNKKLIIESLIVLAIVLVLYYLDYLCTNILSLVIAIIFAWHINKNSLDLVIGMVKSKIHFKR